MTDDELAQFKKTLDEIKDDLTRLCGLSAQTIVTARRADAQSANGRLQQQAALNTILEGQDHLLAILTTPEALAGVAPALTLDQARQIKRKTTIALTGRDPASKRKRDDEITLVSIPILRSGGERRTLRVNKRLAKILIFILGAIAVILAKKAGLPIDF